jgi:hypothetical protein
MPGNPFIGLEGERGGQATEEHGWQRWWRHDGGGSSRFRRGSIGAVVGSDEGGGAPTISGAEGAVPEGSARAHT